MMLLLVERQIGGAKKKSKKARKSIASQQRKDIRKRILADKCLDLPSGISKKDLEEYLQSVSNESVLRKYIDPATPCEELYEDYLDSKVKLVDENTTLTERPDEIYVANYETVQGTGLAKLQKSLGTLTHGDKEYQIYKVDPPRVGLEKELWDKTADKRSFVKFVFDKNNQKYKKYSES